ncbi:MAG: helix-turn-helix domain-containing protein [Defluviitaleaceae bacterium]|nr:helix-turn-helix domain-containing protein [Defluviitaleaceae bacterium]
MPIFDYGKAITALRNRRKWSQGRLVDSLDHYEPMLNRIEKGKALPREERILQVLDTLGTPLEDFINPDNVLTNPQYQLSEKAKVMEHDGRPDYEIEAVIYQGLEITFDDIDDSSPGKTALLFEEPELFHTLARIRARQGELVSAVRILTETKDGLIRLPEGERERDRHIIQILLTLADCQLQMEAYQDALDTCELGLSTSAIRNEGMGTPDFLLLKVKALSGLGQAQEITALLKLAYAGYLLLGEKENADQILHVAKDNYDVQFDTYGMEKLDIPQIEKQPYARGKMPPCSSIGEMISLLRKEAEIELKELSQGICSVANLSKIERNVIKRPNMHQVEPLMQRLGRDPQLYCNFFLKKDDFDARELRDHIHLLLVTGKHDQAAVELEKLRGYRNYKEGVNLQFILRVEAMLFINTYGAANPECEKMLLQALALTWPDYNERGIYRKPLTHNESVIIDCLAVCYMATGDYKRASKIYDAMLENLDSRCVDEQEKSRMYAGLSYNYSICLGKLDRRRDAMEVIVKAVDFDRSHSSMLALPLLIYNKAFNLYERNEKEKSLAYFAMALYGFMIFKDYGRAHNIPIAQRRIMTNFGIAVD